MSTNGVRRHGLQASYVSIQKTHQINIVDQIDEHGTATRLTTPCRFEIVVVFVPSTHSRHTDRLPKHAGIHDGLGLPHDGVMSAMVSHQCWQTFGLRHLINAAGICQRIGNRFFNHDGSTAIETIYCNIGMRIIRCGNDHSIRFGFIQ